MAGEQQAGLLQEHFSAGVLSTIPTATIGVASGSLSRSHARGYHRSQYLPKRVDPAVPSFTSTTPATVALEHLRFEAEM